MFNVLLKPFGQRRRPARWWASLGAAALHFSSLGGCALDERPGDGVVSDGLEVTINPTLVYDAGLPQNDADTSKPCQALPQFEQAIPYLVRDCATDCHDGTKSMAGFDLFLGGLKANPAGSCAIVLGSGVGAMLVKKLDAPVLTSADPGRADHKHDFKYKTPAEFAAYRDVILSWISAERPDLP
ncbi:MAG TPA: hypothetical protein VFZ61_24640 [Polyangiales bacterium]